MKASQKGITALLILLGGTIARAQRPTEIVKWTAETTKATAAAASVTLSATITDGWHVYALSQGSGGPTPLKISVPEGSAFTLKGPVAEASAIRHFDTNFKMETLYYLKSVNFNVALQGTATAAPESIPIDVRFQACNDRLCLPPYTAHLTSTRKGK
jgi:DsbC/DsbD-like thiol-disulfide interchange protein